MGGSEIPLVLDATAKGSIIYMLRTASQNHVQMAIMADNKANILVAACFIVISLLGGRIVNQGWDALSGVLVLFALLTALFGVLAVIPRSTTRQCVDPTHFNILFFGHAPLLSKQEYLEQMNSIMHTDQQIYQAMLNDIYSSAQVLKKKYRYLRYSYLMFIIGMSTPIWYFLLETIQR